MKVSVGSCLTIADANMIPGTTGQKRDLNAVARTHAERAFPPAVPWSMISVRPICIIPPWVVISHLYPF